MEVDDQATVGDEMQVKPAKPEESIVMRVGDIARQLDVSPSTVIRMIQDGRLKGIVWPSGPRNSYRVLRSAYHDFLHKNGGHQPG